MPAKTIWERSGVDSDTEITKFVMEDFAAALEDAGWAEKQIVEALRKTTPQNLANALCEASRWPEIFEDYAADLLAGDE